MIINHDTVGIWYGHTVYSVPVRALLGVKNSVTIRKLSIYPTYVDLFLSGHTQTVPLICFVAGDGMLRVKHGNLLFWVAKETKTKTHLLCVFSPSPDESDALLIKHKRELGLNETTYH